MVAQWAFFISTGQVPEMRTEPIRLAFHLAGELITALGLVVSGAGVLRQKAWASLAYLVFSGMLLYSVIASPGYFAQQGQWAFVLLFAVLLVLAVLGVVAIARHRRD